MSDEVGGGGRWSPERHQKDYLQGFGLLVLMFGRLGRGTDLRMLEEQTSSCVSTSQEEQQQKKKKEERVLLSGAVCQLGRCRALNEVQCVSLSRHLLEVM